MPATSAVAATPDNTAQYVDSAYNISQQHKPWLHALLGHSYKPTTETEQSARLNGEG